jgi:Cu(I)/Ag(I) efflux system protein CusF
MSFTDRSVLQGVLAALAVGSAVVAPAWAQQAGASGEVRRVDAAAGKITLTHGEIPDLKLPAMSMVYRADPSLLQGLKPGDKVTFTARRENGQYVITAISK